MDRITVQLYNGAEQVFEGPLAIKIFGWWIGIESIFICIEESVVLLREEVYDVIGVPQCFVPRLTCAPGTRSEESLAFDSARVEEEA